MPPRFLAADWGGLAWTPFAPLADRGGRPAGGGVYRIRVANADVLAYVGQTGRDLRGRLGALRAGALAAEMPFNDPDAAAPRLWSFRTAAGWEFEASAASIGSPKADRTARECFLIWDYRRAAGRSPPCNFGRLHPRFTASRSRRSGARGRRLDPDDTDNTGGESVPPLEPAGRPGRGDWMGLAWSAPAALRGANVAAGSGVYALLDAAGEVVYVGESTDLRGRLRAHAAGPWGGLRFVAHAFGSPLTPTQLLEVENDLIGAYFAEHGRAPRFQFGAPGESPAD